MCYGLNTYYVMLDIQQGVVSLVKQKCCIVCDILLSYTIVFQCNMIMFYSLLFFTLNQNHRILNFYFNERVS